VATFLGADIVRLGDALSLTGVPCGPNEGIFDFWVRVPIPSKYTKEIMAKLLKV
jgi:hypothetical protein